MASITVDYQGHSTSGSVVSPSVKRVHAQASLQCHGSLPGWAKLTLATWQLIFKCLKSCKLCRVCSSAQQQNSSSYFWAAKVSACVYISHASKLTNTPKGTHTPPVCVNCLVLPLSNNSIIKHMRGSPALLQLEFMFSILQLVGVL